MRQDVDRFALRSHQCTAHAIQSGYFDNSIVPIRDQNDIPILERDEHSRPGTTLETLGTLRPAFATMGEMGFDAVALQAYPEVERINHVYTASNSSGIVDGAAVVLVGSRKKGKALGLKPRARIVSSGLVGTEPTIMLIGPGPASKKALRQAGMNVSDIDLFEVNEAFASVVLHFMRDLDIEGTENLNVNGGAIAMGHPLRATRAMLLKGQHPRAIESAGLKAGMPVGPLAIADEVSLSLMEYINEQTRRDLATAGQQVIAHPADTVMQIMTGRYGRLGKAHSAGFYEYPTDQPKHLWPQLHDLFPQKEWQLVST